MSLELFCPTEATETDFKLAFCTEVRPTAASFCPDSGDCGPETVTGWFCRGSKFKDKLLREPSFVHFATPATTVHHGSLWAKVEPHPGPVACSSEPPREAKDYLCSDKLEFLKCGRKMGNLENPVENQTQNLRTQTQREHANSTHRETPGN